MNNPSIAALGEDELKFYLMALANRAVPGATLDHIEDVMEYVAGRVAVLKRWEPIICEIDRRAEKECCLEERCDFTVTISHDDYAAIANA